MQWSDNERKKENLIYYRRPEDYETHVMNSLAWENSRHFATPPLAFSWNDVWETSAEIPYWWRVSSLVWIVFLIGRAAREICFNQSETLPIPEYWRVISMEFLRSFLRRHFTEKAVVASPNVLFAEDSFIHHTKINPGWWKLNPDQTHTWSLTM